MLVLNIVMSVWVSITAGVLVGRFGNSYTWRGLGITFWGICGAVLTILAIWLSWYQWSI